jgi:hypothetical protein
MASIVVAGDTSGTVTLTAPAVAGTTTLTLPTTSGTVLTSASTITPSAGTVTQASLSTNVAGNGPAFSAYAGAAQNTTSNVYTKVLFPNEEWDTNSNFASSTFTPTVAGYYQLNISVSVNGAPTRFAVQLYKNGSAYKMLTDITCGSGTVPNAISGSAVVYFNGSTDYVEVYANQVSATGFYSVSTTVFTWFNGSMIRSA